MDSFVFRYLTSPVQAYSITEASLLFYELCRIGVKETVSVSNWLASNFASHRIDPTE